jgi:hypothetical protein
MRYVHRSAAAALLFATASLVDLLGAPSLPGAAAGGASPLVKTENFDRDPGWDGHNNRSRFPPPRTVRQDFGWSSTSHTGRARGEIGGFVCPAAEPAYYAKTIPARSFDDTLSASGTLVVFPGGTLEDGAGNTLVGFFNADTLNEWRTPNTVALRINGRGDGFHAHLEYATGRWRAGAEFFGQVNPATGRKVARLFPSGSRVHTWSLKLDPAGNRGGGTITATLDGETLVCKLDPGHQADGATFNRFGLLNVMTFADEGGSLWLGDVRINGAKEPLERDPGWNGFRNRRSYTSRSVRPRFDFGYSPTGYAGGRARGECGGLLFRGDQRYPERLAYYGARLEPLTLDRPLLACGKICLRRGVTDSTILVGFFNAPESVRTGPEQVSGIPENFAGAAVEGPSREGFFFYPVYGLDREGAGAAPGFDSLPPRILPDGRPHSWSLEYAPSARAGRITVTLDGRSSVLELTEEHRAIGARFNRFGFVTTHIDGNGQHVYLDDLTYTFRQER